MDVDKPLFDIQIIPGKGRGLVARSDIPTGTRILCEKPIFVVQAKEPDQLEPILAEKLKRLSKADQRHFLSLTNAHPGKNVFVGIARTNALPCGKRGAEWGAIYPTICFTNHSCVPNAHTNWNNETERQTVHAIRPIEAGEEITIGYDQGGPSAVRKAFLKKSFGFECECPACTLPPIEQLMSDARRIKIQRLDTEINDPYAVMRDPGKSLESCLRLFQVLYQEYGRYTGAFFARLSHDAFQICAAHGDAARASVFAQRSSEARVVCEGKDSPETRKMKALTLKPTDHRGFGVFSKKWETKKDMVPTGLEDEEFRKWLFRV